MGRALASVCGPPKAFIVKTARCPRPLKYQKHLAVHKASLGRGRGGQGGRALKPAAFCAMTRPMCQSTLILGGAKSGKTALAQGLAQSLAASPAGRLVYIATAQAGDQEMSMRISRHQAQRGPRWSTLEEPLDLIGALGLADAPGAVLLVDCLTLWLSNLMTLAVLDQETVAARGQELARALPGLKARVILVANEVGLGIVPDNPLARAFRDQAGRLNQRLAAVCQNVVLVAAGLPLALKGSCPSL